MSVLDRIHPEWDPIGVREGAFVILPKVNLGVAYNDNVFATASGAKGDIYWTVSPSVTINSNWNQNAVSLYADASLQRYATYVNQDGEQYHVILQGTYDVYHDMIVTGYLAELRVLIPRVADAYSRDALTPLYDDETGVTIGVVKTFNALKLTANGTFLDLVYENGVAQDGKPLDESFQNLRSYSLQVEAEYALTDDVALYVQQSIAHGDLNSILREHDDTQTLIGPNFRINHLLTAELGVGYITSRYHDPLARPVGNFSEQATVHYFPTGLTTVTLSASESVTDSGLVTTPAYLQQNAGIEVDHELLRNLLITGILDLTWNKYEVIQRYDHIIEASLAAKYKVSHGVALALSVSHLQRRSSGAQSGVDFAGEVVSLAVTLQR
jgi:hypothetical protein